MFLSKKFVDYGEPLISFDINIIIVAVSEKKVPNKSNLTILEGIYSVHYEGEGRVGSELSKTSKLTTIQLFPWMEKSQVIFVERIPQ